MKFRIVIEPNELTIITENGGIACTREAEGDVGEPRVATTDYYQNYINSCSPATLFDELAEGEMEFKDWATEEFNSCEVIKDALNWLSPETSSWKLCNDLFLDFFPKENSVKSSFAPVDFLKQIHDIDAFDLVTLLLENPKILQNNYLLAVLKAKNHAWITGDDMADCNDAQALNPNLGKF